MARPRKTWQEIQAEAEMNRILEAEKLASRLETKQYKQLEKLNFENKLKKKKVSLQAENEVLRKHGLPEKYNAQLGYPSPDTGVFQGPVLQWQSEKEFRESGKKVDEPSIGLFQGPVQQGYDETKFRQTGKRVEGKYLKFVKDIKTELGWNKPGERLKTRVISALYDKPSKKDSMARGFSKQFSQIAKAIPRQRIVRQPVVDVRQILAQQQQMQRPKPQRRNFFEHGSELEVYGDEGLTFFDSEKRSQGKSTGSLFGLSDD